MGSNEKIYFNKLRIFIFHDQLAVIKKYRKGGPQEQYFSLVSNYPFHYYSDSKPRLF